MKMKLPTIFAVCLLVSLHGWTCVEASVAPLEVDLDFPDGTFFFEDSGTFRACAVLNTSPDKDVMVTIATSDREPGLNSAQAGTDYTPVNETFNFYNGTTNLTQCVNITIIDNEALERVEFFDIEINATIPISGDAKETIGMTDSGPDFVTVELEETQYTITEGDSDPVPVCASLVPPGTQAVIDVEISFAVETITATAGLDAFLVHLPFTIPTGQSRGCRGLTAIDDSVVEDTETLIISLMSADAEASGNATVSIIDNDGAMVRLVSDSLSVEERNSGETSQVELCFQVITELERSVGLLLNTMPGMADNNTDYEPLSNEEFVIPSATNDTVCYSLTINGDDEQELNETFMVTVSTVNVVDQINGTDTVTVTILQDGDMSTALFQLRLVGDFICEDWVKENTARKIEDITAAVASELASRCSCSFTSDLIANNSQFNCSDEPKDVVIFAQLFGVIEDDVQASALIDHLKDWVDGGDSIMVINETLTIYSECDVEIESFDVCSGAMVRLVSDTLSVEERNSGETSQVELCFQVITKLVRSVGLLLNTMPGTADNNTDYEPLSNEEFVIPSTTRLIDTVCYSLTINGDDEQELNETFMVTVSTVNVVDQINGTDTATVTILQDGDTSTALFQLRLVGDFICEDWVKENTARKIEDITASVASELASRCSCSFTSDLIANNSQFRCSDEPKDVVIFAQLFGVIEDDVQASALIDHLKDWVDGGDLFIVINETLTIYSECDVEIESFDVDPCPRIDTGGSSSDDDDAGAIAGGVVGGVVLIALIVIVIIFIILLIRHKSTHKWDPKKASGLLGSVELADNAADASGQPPQGATNPNPDPGYAAIVQETQAQSAPETAGETEESAQSDQPRLPPSKADAPIPEYAVVQKKKKAEQPPQPDEDEGEDNVMVFENN